MFSILSQEIVIRASVADLFEVSRDFVAIDIRN